jgi:hypothetical protein
MTKWILIIFIVKELWIPILAFDSEDECYAYIDQMELAPGMHVTCLPGVIEREQAKKKAAPRRMRPLSSPSPFGESDNSRWLAIENYLHCSRPCIERLPLFVSI